MVPGAGVGDILAPRKASTGLEVVGGVGLITPEYYPTLGHLKSLR